MIQTPNVLVSSAQAVACFKFSLSFPWDYNGGFSSTNVVLQTLREVRAGPFLQIDGKLS